MSQAYNILFTVMNASAHQNLLSGGIVRRFPPGKEISFAMKVIMYFV